jgi:NAD(P)-dependent dehydrogenase (short-subunit alcohol dehydrogenase family)
MRIGENRRGKKWLMGRPVLACGGLDQRECNGFVLIHFGTGGNMGKQMVLVTGGGAGIGEGIAQVLAERGWHVLVNDIDAAAALRVAQAVGGTALPGDIRTDPQALISSAVAVGGALHALVNNAGIIRRSALADTSEADLDLVYEVNLKSMVRLSQAALPHLQLTGGAVVNISSIAAENPQPGAGFYSMSKAGVTAFTRHAAQEWGPLGVRVNAVAPGLIRTAMAEAVYAIPELHEKRRLMMPLRRIGTPVELGKVVAFLLSDDATYVSGQVIAVDGGFSQTLICHLPHPPTP